MDALTRSLPTWSAAEYGRRLEAQRSGTLVQFAAWDAGAPIGRGHVLFPGHEQWSISAWRERCAEVRDVFVAADRRRAGIAKALMATLEQTTQDRDMSRIGLMVTLDEDHGPARALYRSLGYEKAHGPFVSSVTLQTDAGPRPVLAVAVYLLKKL